MTASEPVGESQPEPLAIASGRPHTVTYSAAYTVVPTYECFNRCTYCNFREEPGSEWLSLDAAREQLEPLRDRGICEILILSGEVHPKSPRREALIDRIVQLCELAVALGFLPHTNAGPVSEMEMLRLKSVNVSMGLMLEQMSDRLLDTVHRHAPSKVPALRLAQLEQAGRLQIPFTTGILIGLGETADERRESLEA
ncbi:MAG: 7,8-didemethyl-8-hydroxy-5-deazariboflavin synthase subunit CofG, partial [Cyanobacteria bacterium J06639_1]